MQNLNENFREQMVSSIQAMALINYVWINREADNPDRETPLCSIPLHYIDMALCNARKYPDARFIIWLDCALIDEKSRSYLTSHTDFSTFSNVELRDLNQIQSYQDDEIFKRTAASIWSRVDLARLLVLEYCQGNTERPYIFYSDFDVEDLKLDDPALLSSIMNNGFVFGRIFASGSYIENGYLGIDTNNEDANNLFQEIRERTSRAVRRSENGYESLKSCIRNWIKKQGSKAIRAEDISISVLPASNTPLPIPRAYLEQGLVPLNLGRGQ